MKCKWTERKCWDFLLCEWWVVNFFLSCWLIIREEFNDCQQKIFFMFLLVVVCGERIFFDMETSTRSNHRFFVLLMPTVKLWKKHWKIEAQSPQQQRLQLRHKQQQVEDIFSCWLSQTDLQFFFLQFSIAHLNHNCSHDLLSFFLLIFYVFFPLRQLSNFLLQIEMGKFEICPNTRRGKKRVCHEHDTKIGRRHYNFESERKGKFIYIVTHESN